MIVYIESSNAFHNLLLLHFIELAFTHLVYDFRGLLIFIDVHTGGGWALEENIFVEIFASSFDLVGQKSIGFSEFFILMA